MQISLRLYYPTDVDLIAIRLLYGKNFQTIVRNCLASFINKKEYILSLPSNMGKYARATDKPIIVNFSIKDSDDIAIYFQKIRPYAKSDIIKTIVRSCYEYFPAGLFLFDGDTSYRTNKKSVRVEIAKSSKAESTKDEAEDALKVETESQKEESAAKSEEQVEAQAVPDKTEKQDDSGDEKQSKPSVPDDYYLDEESSSEDSEADKNGPSEMDIFNMLQGMIK